MAFPESEYCTFLFADGRRCRTLKMPTREVCLEHWRQDGQFNEDEVAVAELAAQGISLRTPANVNRALACLWRLTAQGKLPHRKAALLAYIGHLLLCTMPRHRTKEDPLPALPETVQAAIQPPPAPNPSGPAPAPSRPNGPPGSA